MKRALYKELLDWKNSPSRKPLLLQGARQVGKTYLVKEFAQNEYENFIQLNFEEEPELKTLFTGSLKAQTVIENISLYIGKKIDPAKTLIFFDEVQTAPDAITSLKYFNEQLPEYHIIAAGSLLGVSTNLHRSFPVGKVNFLTLYPMSFFEYLEAAGEELLSQKLQNIVKIEAFPEIIHQKLLNHLKKYFFLGGMPEVVKSYIHTNDIALSRKIQNEILEAYQRDFSKHTGKQEAIKISQLWHSIPYQLAKENKKLKYSNVRKNARASTYEHAIEWLRKAGLINIAYNISVPKLPLSAYANSSKLKIYFFDNGLLGAMLKLTSDIIIKPDNLFKEHNGAFTENFTATELVANGTKDLYYWTSKSDAEVDFILRYKNNIYPLEVKSGTNRNIKSLRSYEEKYHPELLIRTSPRNFIKDKGFINLPLYAIGALNKIINYYSLLK